MTFTCLPPALAHLLRELEPGENPTPDDIRATGDDGTKYLRLRTDITIAVAAKLPPDPIGDGVKAYLADPSSTITPSEWGLLYAALLRTGADLLRHDAENVTVVVDLPAPLVALVNSNFDRRTTIRFVNHPDGATDGHTILHVDVDTLVTG